MLLSLALIFLAGMVLGRAAGKIGLPPLAGMLAGGILLGPYVSGLLSDSILSISADLRKIALIIILIRAGLNLDTGDLKKVGRPAVLMSFVPATCEILGVFLFGQLLFGLSGMESLLLGSVLAAVSPAVVVPHMLKLMDGRYGTKEGIPQLILAGASVDDIYVIVLFSCFTSLVASGDFSPLLFLRIPTSIVLGVLAGILCGFLVSKLFRKVGMTDAWKIILLFSVSLLLNEAENRMTGMIGFSGLLAIMTMGLTLRQMDPHLSLRLSSGFGSLWAGAEILLFVLVGAAVDIRYAAGASGLALLLIFGSLIFRMAGVWLSVQGTSLNPKERLFCMIAYTPKATVQAAIGSIPLSMGFACGNTVLTCAVIAILVTAPLGAFGIDHTYQKLLSHDSVVLS